MELIELINFEDNIIELEEEYKRIISPSEIEKLYILKRIEIVKDIDENNILIH